MMIGIVLLLLVASASAFTVSKSRQQRAIDDSSWSNRRRSFTSSSTADDANAALSSSAARDQAEVYLTETYPKFCTLLRQNPKALERMRSSTSGYAVFAPTDAAFDALGPERLHLLDMALGEIGDNEYNKNNNYDSGGDDSLVDVLSTMAEYHMCSVPATAHIMKTYGVVTTSMGELPVTVTEDGTTMYVNGVRVIRSYQFEERLVRDYRDVNGYCLGTEEVIENDAGFELRRCIIHETEGLVCPDELWNIMYARAQQLRPSSSAAGLSAI